MEFEQAYEAFMESHIAKRTGERRGRLMSRNFHAEKLFLKNIWWVLKGNLDDLHPEYEILDWRGRPYYADLAWRTPWNFILLLEIKGFAPHVRDLDRTGFDNETSREAFLQGIGYRILSFSYDNVAQKPDLCITLLRIFVSQFESAAKPVAATDLLEKEIMRLAFKLARPFRPIDMTRQLQINYRTAKKRIGNMVAKELIAPVPRGQGKREVSFKLTEKAYRYLD